MSSDLIDPGADELSRACRIDSACDRFETAWKSDSRPRIEDYLSEIVEPERLVLACELILLDIHYRRLAGQTCLVADYDSRFLDLDPTWLEGVISGRTGDSSISTVSHQPEAVADALTTTKNGETIPLLPTGSLQSFGDYEIRGVIGESGMGVVYKAWQRSLNRFVAVKTIRHGRGLSRSAVERFRAEAEMAAHLDHPNILPIYEVNEHEGQPYFTMKLIEGVDLARLPPGFTEDQRAVARLVATAARAVHHAHQRGILHRDLKPANILLEWPAGPDRPPVPHVADFGLAKRLDVDMHLSLEDGLVGTPVYMAPEQALRKSDLTTAVDVHGLGAVLYFLLTGQPPFKAETILETVRQVIEREPARPRSLKPRVDRDLEIICLKCLEKRPQDRLRSAEEVAEELELWLAGKPIRSRSASTPEKILKWVRRRPAVAALLAVSMVAMLALVGVGVGLWYSAKLQTVNEGLIEAREKLEQTNGELETAIGQKEVANTKLEQEKVEVEKQRQRARLFLYDSQINLADRALKEGKPGLALQFLEQQRYPQTDQKDLRGPEWYHLWHECHGDLFALHGHTGEITCIALSPDDCLLASASSDKTVKIWDLTTRELVRTLVGYTDTIVGVAFSGDGTRLASMDRNGMIRLLNPHNGRSILEFKGHAGHATSVAFSRDGTQMATACYFSHERTGNCIGSEIKVWDAAKGLENRVIKVTGQVTALLFSPDCQSIAASGTESVKVWSLKTGQECFSPEKQLTDCQGIAFSHDSRRLAAAYGEWGKEVPSSVGGGALVWDVSTGKVIWHVAGYKDRATSVAFSADGQRLATACADGTLKVLDAAKGVELISFSDYACVWGAIFSADGRTLISGGASKVVRIWNVAKDKHLLKLDQKRPVYKVAISPDKQRLAIACGDWNVLRKYIPSVSVYDIKSNQVLFRVEEEARGIFGIAFSSDGRYLATASGQPTFVKVWDATNGKQLAVLNGHGSKISACTVAFSPDGKRLASAGGGASASDSGELRVWDWETGKEVLSIKTKAFGIYCIAFSPDGRFLAGASAEGVVRLWDTHTGGEFLTLRGFGYSALCLAFSPDGRSLVAGCGWSGGARPCEIKVWDLTKGQESFTLRGHSSSIFSVAFSPDGLRLASASGAWHSKTPGEVKIWDLTSGQDLFTLRDHQGPVYAVAYSSDGRCLATCSEDGTVRIIGDLTGMMR
jgi:WD40 repeat protein